MFQGLNEVNERLLKIINDDCCIYLVLFKVNDIFFLRFVVCVLWIELKDVKFVWEVIQELMEKISDEKKQYLYICIQGLCRECFYLFEFVVILVFLYIDIYCMYMQ